MDGFRSHTYSLINEKNELFYVKWHFKTKQGIKNFTGETAEEMRGKDPDYAQRDLYGAIAKGDFPKWRVRPQDLAGKEGPASLLQPFFPTHNSAHRDHPPPHDGSGGAGRDPP